MAASLQFFLTRPGAVQTSKSRVRHGTNVPLIPVDQLPEWLHIVDVPRVLSDQHAAGLTSVGLACRPPETLEVCVLRARLPAKEEEEGEEGEEDEDEHEAHAPPPPPPPPPQQPQFGRRPGDFIKAQALGTVGQAHAGKNGTEAERPAVASPEQRSLSSDLLRALDEDLAAAAAERARQRNSRAAQQPPPPPLQNTLDDGQQQQQQQQQPQGGGGAQGDRHHPPSRCAPVAASHQPVVAAAARAGLASSMHAPRVAAEHKAPPPSLVKLPFSRAPGAQQHQQQQQPRGPPSTAEAYDPAWVRHIQGRAAAPGHGRGASYCRHWCVHGTCKWGRNCRYNHAMPATPEGLAEVGLREFPEWWAAAMGLAARGSGPGMEQQPHDGGGDQARHRQPAGEAKAPPPPRGGPTDQDEAAALVRLGAALAPPARARVIRDDDEETLRAAVTAHGYPASMFANRSRRPAAP